jgi:predicted membrane channel-forming protein YqfA (hemolysin III family)
MILNFIEGTYTCSLVAVDNRNYLTTITALMNNVGSLGPQIILEVFMQPNLLLSGVGI